MNRFLTRWLKPSRPQTRLCVCELEGRITPATFTVLSPFDSGSSSLRAMVNAANANPDVDTIVFDPTFFNVPRTIILDGQLPLTTSITIAGTGAKLITLSGGGANRVFDITADCTIKDVTITKGNSTVGGGIRSGANALVLDKVAVTNCTTSGSGGGLAIVGAAGSIYQFTNCSFDRNTAGGSGGGIDFNTAGAALTINGNSLTRNSSAAAGGGLAVSGAGTNFFILNCTISTNTALDGGGISTTQTGGNMGVNSSTITKNAATSNSTVNLRDGGGGISIGNSACLASFYSGILFGNSAANGRDNVAQGAFTYFGSSYSVIGTTTGFSTDNGQGLPLGTDPMLGDLADNGGLGLTHALLPGSPAIDKGNNQQSYHSFDGRGYPHQRLGGVQADMGAYEVQVHAPVFVSNNSDAVDSNISSLSLREALDIANAIPGPDEIYFNPDVLVSAPSINLGSSLTITDSVTIHRRGADRATINAGGNDSAFILQPPASGSFNVRFEGMTINNGSAVSGGGISGNNVNLELDDCRFAGNTVTNFGGAINLTGTGNLSVESCEFTQNKANNSGGAINVYLAYSTVNIRNSTLWDNTSLNSGGAMAVAGLNSTVFTATRSTFSGNTAIDGGALSIALDANAKFVHSTITANVATNASTAVANLGGGGIRFENLGAGTLLLTSTIVAGNTAANGRADLAVMATEVTAKTSAIGNASGWTPSTTSSGNLSAGANLDLQPLADNGGRNFTVAIGPNSAAHDAGGAGGTQYDQRGTFYRISTGTTSDIGAYEYQDNYTFTPTHTWIGVTNGDWGVASNWTPATVPTAISNVLIPGGRSVTITGSQVVNNLDSYGTVNVNGTLTVSGSWLSTGRVNMSGTLAGTGAWTSDGRTDWKGGTIGIDTYIGSPQTIAGEGSARFSISSDNHTFSSYILASESVDWHYGYVSGSSTGIWTNNTDSRFDLVSSGPWIGSGTSRFTNYGRLVKNLFSESTTFNVPLDLAGRMDILTGKLYPTVGGTINSTVLNGGMVHTNFGTFTAGSGNPVVTGSGRLAINYASKLRVDSESSLSIANLTLNEFHDYDGANLLSIDGKLTVTNTGLWRGGYARGTGTLTIGANAAVDLKAPLWTGRGVEGFTVENYGKLHWIEADNYDSQGTHWIHKSGSTFTVSVYGTNPINGAVYGGWYSGSGAPAIITIEPGALVVRDTYSTVAPLNAVLELGGTVQTDTGYLGFTRGGTLNNATLAGGPLMLNGGTFVGSNGKTITSTGANNLSGGLAINGTGKLQVNTGDTFTVGRLTLNEFTDYNGENLLGIDGTLNVTGDSSWRNGFIRGSGTLALRPTATFGLQSYFAPVPRGLDGVTVRNFGTVLWSGGDINTLNGTQWINADSAQFYAHNGGGNWLHTGVGAAPTFRVEANTLFYKDTASNNLYFAGSFQNAGTVQVLQGGLQTAGDYVQTGGRTIVYAVLDPAGAMTMTDGTLEGFGTVLGNMVNTVGTIKPEFGPGLLTVVGDLSGGGGLEFDIYPPNAGTSDKFDVFGNVTLGGALSLVPGYTPIPGDTFVLLTKDGTLPATGLLNGKAEGSTFSSGGRLWSISYLGGTGNDVTLTAVASPVTSVPVNNGALQRSRLTDYTVHFNTPQDAAQFQVPGAVTYTSGSRVVGTNNRLIVSPATGMVTGLTLTFANVNNGLVQYGSLADGVWRLAIPSVGYLSEPNDPAFRRLFGDVNGDGMVDGPNDSAALSFQSAALNPFDFNGDGTVDGPTDCAEFGARFGKTV